MSDINKKLGSYLKSKREAQGKSIDEMADALKITAISITNIENGNIESIGLSDIFIRSYIKSYITELGELPDDVFSKFKDFQNNDINKDRKVITTNTILYSPAILIIAVMLFSAISYFFISHVVERDKQLMDMSLDAFKVKTSKIDDNKKSKTDKKAFSKDYNHIYSNYSETPR